MFISISKFFTRFRVVTFFIVAALAGSTIAIRDNEAGFRNYYDRDFDKAFPALDTKARSGDTQAAYFLGHLFFHGYGTKINKLQAGKWFYEGAQAGIMDSAAMYAVARFNGASTHSCESKLRILENISQTGNVIGLVTLAKFNGIGICVVRDRVRETYYYKLAQRNNAEFGRKATALHNKLSAVEKFDLDKLLNEPRPTLGKREFIRWFLKRHPSPR
jgi:hypothetical protein